MDWKEGYDLRGFSHTIISPASDESANKPSTFCMSDTKMSLMTYETSPKETLELMLGHLGFVFEILEEKRPSGLTYCVEMREPSRLIGKNGKTLEDLQYLLNRIVSTEEEGNSNILIDVGNYRKQMLLDLIHQADRAAQRVMETGETYALPPHNSFDRRIIHNHINEQYPDLVTASENTTSRYKKIIIKKKA